MLDKNDYFDRQAPNIDRLESVLGAHSDVIAYFLFEYLRVNIVTYCEEYFMTLTTRDQG